MVGAYNLGIILVQKLLFLIEDIKGKLEIMLLRYSITSSLLFIASLSFSQDYLGHEKESIAEEYEAMMADDSSGYNYKLHETLNALSVEINGHESMQLTYFFDEDLYCDSIVGTYRCSSCFDYQANRFLEDSYRRWTKFSEGYYVAKAWSFKSFGRNKVMGHPQLHISRNEENTQMIITITEIQKPKKEWEKLFKTIERK